MALHLHARHARKHVHRTGRTALAVNTLAIGSGASALGAAAMGFVPGGVGDVLGSGLLSAGISGLLYSVSSLHQATAHMDHVLTQRLQVAVDAVLAAIKDKDSASV